MTYEAWRCTYQSSEQAARAAYERVQELKAQLAAAQQDAQPFGYVNTHTGQFFKDVEPCRQNNEGHWRTVYTHPTTQGLANDAIERAAKTMSELFDYPWDFMPEQGKAKMREDVKAVLLAAQAKQGEQANG